MSDYFNTGEDSRFVFLENYLRGLLEKAKSKKVPGIRRDELINFIEKVLSLVRELGGVIYRRMKWQTLRL